MADESSRKILEASAGSERELLAEYWRETRRLPAGMYLVETDQPLGAIAVDASRLSISG